MPGVIATLVAIGVSVGCAARPAGAGGFVSGDGTLTKIAPESRVAAPRVAGTTLEGQPWSSDLAAGQVIVYNVWGSWCAPCRKEAPALESAARATRGKAVFVGLNTRDTGTAQALAFVRAFKVTYPSLYDPDGRLLLGFSGQLPPSAIPSTLVVDSRGRIAARILGETTTATLTGLVADIAAGQ